MTIIRRLIFLCFLAVVVFIFLPIQLKAPLGSTPVRGMSMYPTLKEGTLVFVEHASSYRLGEIVAFYDQERQEIVLHRVVAVVGTRYITRGDHNPVDDPYHPTAADIYGSMYWDIPHLGAFALWLRTPLGIGSCLGALFLALIAVWRKSQKPKLL